MSVLPSALGFCYQCIIYHFPFPQISHKAVVSEKTAIPKHEVWSFWLSLMGHFEVFLQLSAVLNYVLLGRCYRICLLHEEREFFHPHFSAYYYCYKRLAILHFLRKPDFWLGFKHMFLCCCLVCSLICHWKPVSTDALPQISLPHSWNVVSIYEVWLVDWQENSCLLSRLNFIIPWPLYRFFSLFKISIKKKNL